ncbi:hypothetical protein RFI_27664 [Reticulomyxa filosa]|uniref:Uncharacterized protein n=1 Tax=Reticulomyxa filosa TaxID=46433 RepID=X6M8B0_RETFI|nr:hypothetical protein RFI_27664 [Reticulomyxa filosa]|eukprot:ETO09707.1 hypothetical protein RFI_27664 [Reticulomyxa filosa]
MFSRQLLRLTTHSYESELHVSHLTVPNDKGVITPASSFNDDLLNVPTPSTFVRPGDNPLQQQSSLNISTTSLTLSTLNDSFFTPLLERLDVSDIVLSAHQINTLEMVTKFNVLNFVIFIPSIWYLVTFIYSAVVDSFWTFVIWICVIPFDCCVAVVCIFLTYKFGKTDYDRCCRCCHQRCLKLCIFTAKRKVKSNISTPA